MQANFSCINSFFSLHKWTYIIEKESTWRPRNQLAKLSLYTALVFIDDILIERTSHALLTSLTYLLYLIWHLSARSGSANLFLVITILQWKFFHLNRIFSTDFQKCNNAFRNKATQLAIDNARIKSTINNRRF